MAPFSSSSVIPPGWEEHHRPVAAATMTAAATVRRPPGPEPYPPDPLWDPAGQLLWSGFCRLQELKQVTSTMPAEQPTVGRNYLITFPLGTDNPLPELKVGERGDVVTIDGVDFLLQHPMEGSLLWERDFIAWANHTQEGGGQP